MTEAEWLACEDPERMLLFLQRKASNRKLRLFAITSFRQVPELCGQEWTWAVQVAEQHADGRANPEDVHRLQKMAWDGPRVSKASALLVGWFGIAAAMTAVWYASDRQRPLHPRKYARPEALPGLAILLRDILGNPFRPITTDPSWLTSTVLDLASQMYESRDFSAMPIIADALQDAGCDNIDILNHCRSEGSHVRGCWVVDIILSKDR
jgi:hypothetical protein